MRGKQPDSVAGIELSQEHIEKIEEFRRRKETAVLVIMFTDLEGSTEIAERRGDEYARRMHHLHNQLLLGIIERDGKGLVIRVVGDEFLCIFSEPSVAVERALEIQRELREYNREHPEEEDIIVRIGMHMGQVSVENHVQPDIFGRHANRAARVVDLADGGHIYLSRSVYENASGWLKEEDLIWQDHGEYEVKGIAEPIRIYEVADGNVISPKPPSQKRHVPLRDRQKIPAEKHVTIIGLLHIGLGVFGILAAIIVLMIIVGMGFLRARGLITVGSTIVLFLVSVSAPGIIGGIGLLKRRPWARVLVLVIAVLNLIEIPIGTILGIYTIRILVRDEAARLFAPESGS